MRPDRGTLLRMGTVPCPQEERWKRASGMELQLARCSEKSSDWKLHRSCEEKFTLSSEEKGNSLDKHKLKTYLESGYASWTFPGVNCCNGMLNKSSLNLVVQQECCLNNEVLMDKFSKALGRNRLLFNWNCNMRGFFFPSSYRDHHKSGNFSFLLIWGCRFLLLSWAPRNIIHAPPLCFFALFHDRHRNVLSPLLSSW